MLSPSQSVTLTPVFKIKVNVISIPRIPKVKYIFTIKRNFMVLFSEEMVDFSYLCTETR